MFQSAVVGAVSRRSVARTVEVALWVLLAGALAQLTWAGLRPLSEKPKTPPAAIGKMRVADLSILGRFDPFFRGFGSSAGTAGGGAQGAGTPVLHAVYAGSGRGTAILSAGGGDQQMYEVGDEIAPGLKLEQVGIDHVILSRGGQRQRLAFPVPGDAPQLAATPASAVDPARLMEDTALLPRMRDGRADGYQVLAPLSSPALASAGLQRGDVLLAVDGVGLTPERVSELPQTLASASEVELRFERAGQIITKRVRVGAQ